jgi:hypothetical protein
MTDAERRLWFDILKNPEGVPMDLLARVDERTN